MPFDADFEESKHPRDQGGKFGSGGGSSTDVPSSTVVNAIKSFTARGGSLAHKFSSTLEEQKAFKDWVSTGEYYGEVYRGVGMSNSEWENFFKANIPESLKADEGGGDPVIFGNLTSWTKDPNRRAVYGSGSQKVLFKTDSLQGRDISDFSVYKEEQEVVGAPNQKFKVTGWDTKPGSGIHVVSLERIDQGAKDDMPVGMAMDPPKSDRQRRAMYAALHGKSTLGIPKSVAKKFVGKGHDAEYKRDELGKFASSGEKKHLEEGENIATKYGYKPLRGLEDAGMGVANEKSVPGPFTMYEKQEGDNRHLLRFYTRHDWPMKGPLWYNQLNGENTHGNLGHKDLEAHLSSLHGARDSILPAKDMSRFDWAKIRDGFRAFFKFLDEEEREPEHAEDDKTPHAASVIFIEPTGHILFAKRGPNEENWPDTWSLPGGKAEDGEEPAVCAAREANEEVGADCAADDLREVETKDTPHGYRHTTFACPVEKRFTPKLNGEHSAYVWAPWDDPPKPLHPGVAATLEALPDQLDDLDGAEDAGIDEEAAFKALEDELEEPEDEAKDAALERAPDGSYRTSAGLGELLPVTTRHLEEQGELKAAQKHPGPAYNGNEAADRALGGYPVKELAEDGTWRYSTPLLQAAARKARARGRGDIARRAEDILANDAGFEEQAHPRGEGGKFAKAASEHSAKAEHHEAESEKPSEYASRHRNAAQAHREAAKASEFAHNYPKREEKNPLDLPAPHFNRRAEELSRKANVASNHANPTHKAEAAAIQREISTIERRLQRDKDKFGTLPGASEIKRLRGYYDKLQYHHDQEAAGKKYVTDAVLNDAKLAADHALAMDWRDTAALLEPATMAVLTLAFDRDSSRSYDVDGRLHVDRAHISKANVCPYWGKEIPDYQKLGLSADKQYKLLRDPEELKKAAKTFNNLPILSEHQPVSADEHDHDLVIGSTGTDAPFDGTYLDNSLVFWPKAAINAIESNKQKQLSCAYRYSVDLTPGKTPDGQSYDGVMRNIVGNHVALVKEGRAGPDVVVGDSVLKNSQNGKTAPVGKMKEQKTMPTTAKLSPTAAFAMGALDNYLSPRLAQDAKVDLKTILLGTTAKNIADRAGKIARDVKRAVRGHLAQDADVDDVEEVIDAIQEMAPEIAEAASEPDQEDLDAVTEGNPDDEGHDSPEMLAKAMEFLKDKLSPEDLNAFTEMMGEENVVDPAEEAHDETEEERMEREKKEAEAGSPRGGAMDAKAVKRAVRLAVDSALTIERERQSELRAAEKFVRPMVGDLGIACDSADQVYAYALEMRGIPKEKVKAMHPSAYRPLLEAMQTSVPRGRQQEPALANDAKPVGSFRERFPSASNIRVMG